MHRAVPAVAEQVAAGIVPVLGDDAPCEVLVDDARAHDGPEHEGRFVDGRITCALQLTRRLLSGLGPTVDYCGIAAAHTP